MTQFFLVSATGDGKHIRFLLTTDPVEADNVAEKWLAQDMDAQSESGDFLDWYSALKWAMHCL